MSRPFGSKNKHPRRLVPAIDRLLAKLPDRKPDECWVWTGSKSGPGYGKMRDNGVSRSCHRIAYTALVGPIPDGLELDHVCRNRACCNPAHLEPVTRAENARRGLRGPGYADERTHCYNGHLWAQNTYIHPDGRRRCHACMKEYRRKRAVA